MTRCAASPAVPGRGRCQNTLSTSDPVKLNRSRKISLNSPASHGHPGDSWSRHNGAIIGGNGNTPCRPGDHGPARPAPSRQHQDFQFGGTGRKPMLQFPVRPELARAIEWQPESLRLPANPTRQKVGTGFWPHKSLSLCINWHPIPLVSTALAPRINAWIDTWPAMSLPTRLTKYSNSDHAAKYTLMQNHLFTRAAHNPTSHAGSCECQPADPRLQ